MIKTRLEYIKRIHNLILKIFEFEDDDIPNYRGVDKCNKAIDTWLCKITDDRKLQLKIYTIIDNNVWGTDPTYKTIANELKEIGVEMEYEKK